MRYQLAYLLEQVRHQVRVQQAQGQVEDWVLRLERELKRALESVQEQAPVAQAEERVEDQESLLLQELAQGPLVEL